jgi:hypothetical protein
MPSLGFIIPLDLNDYLNKGQRVNWCGAQPWWTNQNIQLSNTSAGSTAANVGDVVTVQVGIQGVSSDRGFTEEAQVDHVQAWVCYPNTVPGRASTSLIVDSMQPALGRVPPALDLTGSPAVLFGSSQVSDYQSPGVSYQLFNLTPTWTPTTADILPPNTTAHCCIVATCQGIEDVNGDAIPVGLFVPVPANDLSGIDICNDPHEGQTNITIFPIAKKGQIRGLEGGFAFLSGAANREVRKQVTVEVQPVIQGGEVDPAVLRVLKSGPWGSLPLKPATKPPKAISLRKNTHHCEGWLAKIICEAEEIVEEVIEAVERLLGVGGKWPGHRLKLTLPPNGMQPLVFQAEVDADEDPGTVHVFDIQQTDETGERGGIRVGVVVV